MAESRAAYRYAKAMLDIAREQNILDTVVEDFRTVEGAIEGSRDLQNLLSTPVIDAERKASLLREIFGEKVGEETRKFLALLTKKGRAPLLWGITISFRKQLDTLNGVVPAEVSSAVELTPELRAKIEARLAGIVGKQIKATYRVDESLIGGYVARIDDRLIDASVRHQLERLHETLVQEAGSWTPTL